MLTLRPARPEDAETILAFIHKLALYEKAPEKVVACADDLRKVMTGPAPLVRVLLADWDGREAGFALFFHTFSTWEGKRCLYLEDLFVDPEFRGKGIGKALLSHLAKECVTNNWSRLQWSVLDWNAPSIAFYKSLGAVMMDEWTICKVAGPALSALAEGRN